jgi:hypothetical protein
MPKRGEERFLLRSKYLKNFFVISIGVIQQGRPLSVKSPHPQPFSIRGEVYPAVLVRAQQRVALDGFERLR